MAWDEARERQGLIERIERRLKILGWTRKEFAARLGVSAPLVTQILDVNGDAWLGGEKLLRLPAVLRCGYKWMLTGLGTETDVDAPLPQQLVDVYQQAMADVRECMGEREARLMPPGPRRH